MKTFKQMLRQPVKSVLGVALVALAVAVLCVCVGQAMSVRSATEMLKEQFTTVAIPLGSENAGGGAVPRVDEETLAWVETIREEYPGMIKSIARHGVLSAYVPELTPLNIVSENYEPDTTGLNFEYQYYQPGPYNRPYCCAMLVIELEQIGAPVEQVLTCPVEDRGISDFLTAEAYQQWYAGAEKISVTTGWQVELSGRVTEIVSLPEGYREQVGRVARLKLTVSDPGEVETMGLRTGERYIVYGMDYMDEYWKWLGTENQESSLAMWKFDPFDESKFQLLTEEQRERNKKYYESSGDEKLLRIQAYYDGRFLYEEDLWYLNASSMSLAGPLDFVEYEEIRGEDGRLLELRQKETVTYQTLDGQTVTVTPDAYWQTYRIPSIAPLEGSVEAFLESEAGAAWQAALARNEINNHAFAVIGVDSLTTLADFSLQKTRIVSGREFTEEELAAGARVCILPEELAVANGLGVGDTVALSLYAHDPGLPYQQVELAGEDVNPAAAFWFETVPFTETETYTVIGLSRSEETWPQVEEDPYAFSANTLLVPKTSVKTEMEYRTGIPYLTLVLENESLEQFHQLAMRSGYAGRFRYNDQGYSAIAKNFYNYQKLAVRVRIVGILVYGILLGLFLLLYPGGQRRNVRLMESLGLGRGRRFVSVLLLTLTLALTGSVLGGLLGCLLWGGVADSLREFTGAALTLQIDPALLWTVALTQLPLAAAGSLLGAFLASAPGGMSNRR